MSSENIEQMILSLYGEQRWEEIANLNSSLNQVEKCRLFWVLPTICDLRWINDVAKKYNMIGLASIGCGCGLFEWMFEKYSGLDVIGIELDQSWWCSKYSPPLFLENIIFMQEDRTRTFRVSEKYALLFCYFNNGPAFCNYIENYKGNLIFVIGPEESQGRWTDPLPFDKKFENYGWRLINKKKLDRTNDYITVYSR